MKSDAAQRVVLGVRLERDAMVLVGELRATVADLPVDEALGSLAADGVVKRAGGLVGVSRAARRADELSV